MTKDNQMIELLPCPFCGCSGEYINIDDRANPAQVKDGDRAKRFPFTLAAFESLIGGEIAPDDMPMDAIEEIRAALSTPTPEQEGSMRCAQIPMGEGLVDVGPIEWAGKRGILFAPRDSYIPIGDDGALQNEEYWPQKSDVVIWIDGPKAAEVIVHHLEPFRENRPVAGVDLRRIHELMVYIQDKTERIRKGLTPNTANHQILNATEEAIAIIDSAGRGE